MAEGKDAALGQQREKARALKYQSAIIETLVSFFTSRMEGAL